MAGDTARSRRLIGKEVMNLNDDFSRRIAIHAARLAWTPSKYQTLWGAVSRAVRIPTEFDEDLRFTGAPGLLIRGDSKFRSEQMIAGDHEEPKFGIQLVIAALSPLERQGAKS